MKITFAFCALFLISTAFAWGEPRGGGGGGYGNSGSGGGGDFHNSSDFHTSSSSSPQFRSMGIRSVPHYTNRSRLFTTSSRPSLGMPAYGPRGGAFRASYISPRAMSSSFVRNNMAVVNAGGFRNHILNYNLRENVVGHYYWHNYNGLNFCHYYDRWGCNWYGWNCGAGFYWSCWFGNYWWWYDPAYYRWCYWYDGWWWWQNPDDVTVTYVYNNGQYIPEQSSSASGAQQQSDSDNSQQMISDTESNYSSVPPQEEAPIPAAKTFIVKTFRSKDGKRMVKLSGSSSDAFLYDTTGKPSFKSKYLASGVKVVSYSRGAQGGLRIKLLMKDGTSELYDADGNLVADHS